jgi:hypothetical protein
MAAGLKKPSKNSFEDLTVERDLAIRNIEATIKKMDNELQTAYKRVEKDSKNTKNKELLNEYDFLAIQEKQIIQTQIKKLKELYNYINQEEEENNKLIKEDKKEIKKEINKLEKVLRK